MRLLKTAVLSGVLMFVAILGFGMGKSAGRLEIYDRYTDGSVDCLKTIKDSSPDNWFTYSGCVSDAVFKGMK